MNPNVSSSLIHFTDRLEYLKGIIKNGFRFSTKMRLVQGLVFAILTEVHKPTFVGYIRFNYKPLSLR